MVSSHRARAVHFIESGRVQQTIIVLILIILIATFTMLNLFIALIVNAMQSLHDTHLGEEEKIVGNAVHREAESIAHDTQALREEVHSLRAEIRALREVLRARRPS
jgi:voltage-gated sodium channel